MLWAFFLPLVYIEPDPHAFWNPPYLLFNLLAEADTGVYLMQLHGVFGLNLYDHSYRFSGTPSYWIDPMLVAAVITTVLLTGSVSAFVIPERAQAKNLPATRGVHLRAKFASALVIGMSIMPLAAGFLDLANIDLKPTFADLGWLQSVNNFQFVGPSLTYFPLDDFAKPVTWILTLAGVLAFGSIAWLLISVVRPGRDRYWQAERWTLIFALFGLALAIIGYFGMRSSNSHYYYLEPFLGGCYTTFVIGVFTLTWAWTCRTALFMMMRRYEKAAVDTDEPACFACGYDLRMLASDKCPECGTAVHPEVLVKLREATTIHAESRSTTR